jgi:cholesterol transport system auxiliary component
MTRISRRDLVRSVALIVPAAALGGCNALNALSADPPELYTLSPKSTFDETLPSVDWQLLVQVPVAAAGLDSVRVALRRSPVRLEYYAGVAWTDRAPEMVQTLLVESFENSGRIISVGREDLGLRADYLLLTELREFQAEYLGDGAPEVRCRLNAKLVRVPQRDIVAGENFEYVIPAQSTSFEDIIFAFDEALGKVIRRLVEWVLRVGQAASQPQPLTAG